MRIDESDMGSSGRGDSWEMLKSVRTESGYVASVAGFMVLGWNLIPLTNIKDRKCQL